MTPTEEYIFLHDKVVHLKLCIADYQRQIKSAETQLLKLKDAMLKEFLEDGVLPDDGLTIRKVTPKIIITDEKLLPEKFLKIRKEVDKAALNAHVKEHGLIDGTAMDNGGYTVMLKHAKN